MPHTSAKHLQPEVPVEPEQQKRVLFENFTVLKSSILGHNLELAHKTVVNTVVETELVAVLFDAHSLSPGEVMRMTLFGNYSNATSTDDFTVNVKFNSTVVETVARVGGNKTSAGFKLEFIMFVEQVGAAGTLHDFVAIVDDDSSYAHGSAVAHAIDMSIDQTLAVTLQWANAKAGNTITVFAAMLEHIHKEAQG